MHRVRGSSVSRHIHGQRTVMPMRLLILGVGNPMMRDDGFGPAAIAELAKEPLPSGVEAVDGGTGGLGLTSILEEAEIVIIVDSADMKKVPGTLVQFTPDEVRSLASDQQVSLHQADMLGTLRLMQELGTCPPVTIVAVQPAVVDYGAGLSPEVQAALPRALRMIRTAIASHQT